VDPILNLTVGADPTSWFLKGAEYGVLAGQLSQGGLMVLPVAAPFQGTLVLSVAHAGNVSLLRPLGDWGSHPGDANAPPTIPPPVALSAPVLYLPSANDASRDAPTYELPAGTDLDALVQSIKAAMADGTLLPVPVHADGGGVLVINGASLAFVVVCPPAPAAPSG
jgi:hypothetical protein